MNYLDGGFKHVFIFHNIWDIFSHWLVFFQMVKTTKQLWLVSFEMRVILGSNPWNRSEGPEGSQRVVLQAAQRIPMTWHCLQCFFARAQESSRIQIPRTFAVSEWLVGKNFCKVDDRIAGRRYWRSSVGWCSQRTYVNHDPRCVQPNGGPMVILAATNCGEPSSDIPKHVSYMSLVGGLEHEFYVPIQLGME